MFNKSFNVVIATLSLNNRFCILKKTVILFGYSSTLHHPVTATIKCQFLRGKLLIISCILRVQYLCRRLMHLYFTPWPKKRSKTVKLYWWRSISEMHVIIFWDLLSKVSILLKCNFLYTQAAFGCYCNPHNCLCCGFLACWHCWMIQLDINCNQNIHYTNKLSTISYLHFLGSCVGGGGIFFT